MTIYGGYLEDGIIVLRAAIISLSSETLCPRKSFFKLEKSLGARSTVGRMAYF